MASKIDYLLLQQDRETLYWGLGITSDWKDCLDEGPVKDHYDIVRFTYKREPDVRLLDVSHKRVLKHDGYSTNHGGFKGFKVNVDRGFLRRFREVVSALEEGCFFNSPENSSPYSFELQNIDEEEGSQYLEMRGIYPVRDPNGMVNWRNIGTVSFGLDRGSVSLLRRILLPIERDFDDGWTIL